MPYTDIYLYSPLSIKTVAEGHNKALLLQFILSELFHAMDADKKDHPLEFVFSSPACFFPYDWSYEVGCLNKISEHAELLSFAFPQLKEAGISFQTTLGEILTKVIAQKREKQPIKSDALLADLNILYTLLEPFIIDCSQSENLLLYLLKHKEEIDTLAYPERLTTVLIKMAPNGLGALSHLMSQEFTNRGFHALVPEIERLLAHHEQ